MTITAFEFLIYTFGPTLPFILLAGIVIGSTARWRWKRPGRL